MKITSFVILLLNKDSHKSEVSRRHRSTDTLNMFKSDIQVQVNIIITFSIYIYTHISHSKCNGVQLHAFLTLEPDGGAFSAPGSSSGAIYKQYKAGWRSQRFERCEDEPYLVSVLAAGKVCSVCAQMQFCSQGSFRR